MGIAQQAGVSMMFKPGDIVSVKHVENVYDSPCIWERVSETDDSLIKHVYTLGNNQLVMIIALCDITKINRCHRSEFSQFKPEIAYVLIFSKEQNAMVLGWVRAQRLEALK